jgi:ubiquinone/menaquinone biosynthesis C-methylase UbiE
MSDPVIEEYSRLAPDYDQKWSFYVQASVRETMARLTVRPGDRVLEVGCGTAALLEQILKGCPDCRLVGVDPVPEMLAVARRRLPPQVKLHEAWAEKLPFEDASFDLVASCNMFHYIRRPHEALREMRRVLRIGGQLVITDWCDDYLACRICGWYLRLTSPAHFKVYGWQECLRLLDTCGFPHADLDRYKISLLWGLMTARAEKSTP